MAGKIAKYIVALILGIVLYHYTLIASVELNEPVCKHENIGKAGLQSACSVYHGDGSICWVCPDCGEYVNSKTKDYGYALPFIPPEIEAPEPNAPEYKFFPIELPKPDYKWFCPCGQGMPETISFECSCGQYYNTIEVIMKNIPTWPDYIELEKDLVIKYKIDSGIVDVVGLSDVGILVRKKMNTKKVMYDFPKGTKIYFKGKDEN